MALGRPTKYSPELVAEVENYLKTCGRHNTELPTKEGFGLFIDVDDDTLVEWAKIYPDFSAALKRLERSQKNQLMNDGMYGGKEVNQAMAIFLLKVNHNMIETERRELTGADGAPLAIKLDTLEHGK